MCVKFDKVDDVVFESKAWWKCMPPSDSPFPSWLMLRDSGVSRACMTEEMFIWLSFSVSSVWTATKFSFIVDPKAHAAIRAITVRNTSLDSIVPVNSDVPVFSELLLQVQVLKAKVKSC